MRENEGESRGEGGVQMGEDKGRKSKGETTLLSVRMNGSCLDNAHMRNAVAWEDEDSRQNSKKET